MLSLLRSFFIVSIFSSLLSFTSVTLASENKSDSFAGAEHIALGNRIQLYFANNRPQENFIFHLPNGLEASYGDLVSLGDFYEIEERAISLGKTDSEKKAIFLAAFNSFASHPTSVAESKKILAILHTEERLVQEGMRNGEAPEAVFKKIGNEIGRQLNCATGGGCAENGWWLTPGRYLKLANVDFDHFGKNALIAYKVGHDAAIEVAISARQTGDLRRLELAYAMNAFACHFLSDRFAAGHIRTPRLELYEYITPSVTGSLLSNFMHSEENSYGLHVHNLRGDHWIAYGDQYFFNEKNRFNAAMVVEALQISANQIFSAYVTGSPVVDDTVLKMIPIADEDETTANMDISPLFYWDAKAKKLMRRTDTANVYDRHWTANWWGWSTLIILTRQNGISDVAQAVLAKSTLANQALKDGLITSPIIRDYIHQHNK